MRVNNSDSINTNLSTSISSQVNQTINIKPVISDYSEKAGALQNNKDRSQSLNRSISQLSEYEKDNMPVSERVVIDAIQKANKAIMGGNRRFEFSIHEETNEIVVKVFNSDTDELIKEIPNEKILDMVAKICEMAGIFVDERR